MSAQCSPSQMHMEHAQSTKFYAPTKASIKEFRLYPVFNLRQNESMQYAFKISAISSLNGQLPSCYNHTIADSQPKNPEFRNNPENFHPETSNFQEHWILIL